jgi:formate dehydrogenase (NADP+) alpha subunit
LAPITFTLNGKTVTCPSGASVLEAGRLNGVKIPTLCHHDDLKPHGACRICLVEDEKSGRLMAACVTPAAQGISLLTHSPQVLRHRRNIVRLMMAEHPESCVVCDKGNRCRLRGIAAELGIGENGLYPMPNYKPLEQTNPFIVRDLSKCILCGKCIRADHELVAVGAIDYNLRGFKSRPCTLNDRPLEDSACTFCGTCVSMCPTGALSPAGASYTGTPERVSRSVCGFCAIGCALSLGIAGRRVVEVNPAAQPDSPNRSTLCVRGHFAHDYLDSARRLTRPSIRKAGALTPVPWDEALAHTAQALTELARAHGPGSLAFIGSVRGTNEENYLFQKMGRAALGSPNIDNSGHFGGRRLWQRIDARTGGIRPAPFSTLEQAGVILAIGADTPVTLPVMSYAVKRAARNGTPLITAAALPTALDRFAALTVRVPPEGHLGFIRALCSQMLRIEAVDADYISAYTEGFDRFRRELSEADAAAGDNGSPTAARAAELLKGRRIAVIAGHEIIHQARGVPCVDMLLNLLLLSGSLGAPGGGIYVESRDNNLIGAWDMGSAPDMLPGRTPVQDEPARSRWEKAWRRRLSPDPGLNVREMIEAAEKGRLKGLYILGENPLRALPEAERVRKALANVDFIVVQDSVHHETVDLAHVALPGTPFSEKAGSFTNLEGRIQSFDPAVSPPFGAKPDLEILAELTARLTGDRHVTCLKEVRKEISRLVPSYAALDGDRRGAWVSSQPIKRAFHPEGRGEAIAFTPPGPAPSPEPAPDEHYPFTAALAPALFHAGGGTRTGLSPRIGKMAPGGAVRISAADCLQLQIEPGSRVRVTSRRGALERPITVDPQLPPGTIVVPLGFNCNEAAQLGALPPAEDAAGAQPTEFGYACRVRVEKAD